MGGLGVDLLGLFLDDELVCCDLRLWMKELGTEGDEGGFLYRISRVWAWEDLLH
jgi:hypothetical protein